MNRVSLADLEEAGQAAQAARREVEAAQHRLAQLVAQALAEDEVSIAKVCRAAQISRQTAYRWHRERERDG